MDQVLSDLILDIHRGATRISVDNFQCWAFEQIQVVLPFDSGIWVNGHTKDKQFFTSEVSTYNQREELYHLRNLYDEHSYLLGRMMREPGIPLNRNMLMPESEFRELPIYKEYFSKYDMEYALGTVKRLRNTDHYSYMGLYRSASSNVFSERDRRTKQTLLLHLFDSYRYCRFYHFIDHKYLDDREVGKLVVDNEGVIRDLSDNVAVWFKRQWPEWSGPYLPAELKELGTEIVQEFKAFRAKINKSKDDLVGIELHPI